MPPHPTTAPLIISTTRTLTGTHLIRIPLLSSSSLEVPIDEIAQSIRRPSRAKQNQFIRPPRFIFRDSAPQPVTGPLRLVFIDLQHSGPHWKGFNKTSCHTLVEHYRQSDGFPVCFDHVCSPFEPICSCQCILTRNSLNKQRPGHVPFNYLAVPLCGAAAQHGRRFERIEWHQRIDPDLYMYFEWTTTRDPLALIIDFPVTWPLTVVFPDGLPECGCGGDPDACVWQQFVLARVEEEGE